ncbi:HD-GYP domain-containing protein [Paenibacillus sp. NFR01]|uniref:HD-GYP domain-containing protein n=1 Tax=Paenibacillus sp. NFR01 TaxID=1566279 RepID=UPI0008B646EE|nr:HD domain-containing phosphohydrolase [Paenibacillus sp. NFR01]SET13527.1 HDIG domain-containing protein [Paenibacillus sp. NFR01]
MKVHVTDLKPGDRLQSDTFNPTGLHALSRGTVLRREDIQNLIRIKVEHVNIELRDMTQALNGDIEDHGLHDDFDAAILNYESIFMEALRTGHFTISLVDDTLRPLMAKLETQKDIVSLLLLLDRDDIDTYHHSLQVGLLSYYLALWLGYPPEERFRISRAGYLHDIGKSQVPLSILNKLGPLDDAEERELKRHTSYGYEIIYSSMEDESAALVALQHHEWADGTGYPHKLRSTELHPYTEIVTVANIYMGLITSRLTRPKQGLHTVLRMVHEMGFGKLSGNVVQALTSRLLPGFVGRKVQLSSGEHGVIVMNNALDPFKPLVQVNDLFLDLSRERSLTVEEVYI